MGTRLKPSVVDPSTVNRDVALVSGPIGAEFPSGVSRHSLWMFLAVLGIEGLSMAAVDHPWWQIHQALAAPIAFGVALLIFGRDTLRQIPRRQVLPIRAKFVALHGLVIAAVIAADFVLRDRAANPSHLNDAVIAVWFASILLLPVSLAASLVSLRSLIQLSRRLRNAGLYALLTTIAVMAARTLARHAWDAEGSPLGRFLQRATFAGVKFLLGLVYPAVVVFPAHSVVGTPKFAVEIGGVCSGIEGLGLMLVLTLGWLVFVRGELRITRAVWLVPVTLVSVWLLNLVRLAVLIAIGDAGHEDIALNGFHSEAGWLMFNLIAIGFLLAAQNIPWLRKDSVPAASRKHIRSNEYRAAAACLLPFLAIVTASLLGRLVSSGFEWFYPLRLIGAALMLWYFRAEYRRMDWRFGWVGITGGAAVFVGWILLSRMVATGRDAGELGAQLMRLPVWERGSWIVLRCIAAVVTVPIAEELAFRGYLARRVMAADVSTVRFSRLSPLAIVISSVAFGAMHGRMWIAGVLTGLVFALVAKWRGRLGEAVAAHVMANLLLALWVLTRGEYSLW
jgi:exosortase E/protease (VPEID-CTERM system)